MNGIPQGWHHDPISNRWYAWDGAAWQPQVGPPPGYGPPPPPPAFAPPVAPLPGGAAPIGYAVSDPARIKAEQERLQKRGGGNNELGDFPWVEMPFPDRPPIGCQVRVLIRILPARADRGVAEYWLRTYRHEIRDGKKLVETHPCPGTGCEFCGYVKTLFNSSDEGTIEIAKSLKRKERLYLQCAMLENAQGHVIEVDDGRGGKSRRFRPALFGYGQKLQLKFTNLTILRGCSLDHPDQGLNIQVLKTKSGPADMNVEYDAIDVGLPGPMPPEFRPLLEDLCDLRVLAKQPDAQAIHAAVEAVREKLRLATGAAQVPAGYPGAAYPPIPGAYGGGFPPSGFPPPSGAAFPFGANAGAPGFPPPQNGPPPPYNAPQGAHGPPAAPPPGFPPPMAPPPAQAAQGGYPPVFVPPGAPVGPTRDVTPPAPAGGQSVADLERQLLGNG